MITTQLRDKAKWLALCMLTALAVYVMFSDILSLGNYTLDLVVGPASKRDLSITTTATTSVAAGQRRVVRASAVYPLDQAHISPCQLDSALRQVVVIRTCGPLTPVRRTPPQPESFAQDLATLHTVTMKCRHCGRPSPSTHRS
jgi:hypothetical protein